MYVYTFFLYSDVYVYKSICLLMIISFPSLLSSLLSLSLYLAGPKQMGPLFEPGFCSWFLSCPCPSHRSALGGSGSVEGLERICCIFGEIVEDPYLVQVSLVRSKRLVEDGIAKECVYSDTSHGHLVTARARTRHVCCQERVLDTRRSSPYITEKYRHL